MSNPGGFGLAATRVGVSLALVLHLGIALTPPPNNVGAFSVLMATRLFLFAPERLLGGLAFFTQAGGQCVGCGGGGRAILIAAGAVVAAAVGKAASTLAASGGEYSSAFEHSSIENAGADAGTGTGAGAEGGGLGGGGLGGGGGGEGGRLGGGFG
ncbi:hypothetical protein T492DRAFT_856910 [Pavlovales sp. CCMP2436]|nr:hypothetical protein T492DRAFT_856910 [Pavlovales sp. CCMP2436]